MRIVRTVHNLNQLREELVNLCALCGCERGRCAVGGPLWLVSGGGVQGAMAMSLHLFDGELSFFRVSSRVKST